MYQQVSPFLTSANIVTAAIAMNFAAFAAFGIDKSRAERGEWRVSESTLLWLALLGGSPGAFAGRRLFRHKTRKQPFNRYLFHVVVVQVMAAAIAVVWVFGG